MIVKELNIINREIDTREKNKPIRKFLPFLCFLSFVWLCLFESVSGTELLSSLYYMEDVTLYSSTLYKVINVLFLTLADWIWFELIFYFYRMLISFSIFAQTIPKSLFENKARYYIILRNVFLGIFMNLLFFFPYLINFLLIVEIIVDFGIFALFFMSVSRETVSVMIMPNVLKSYFVPFMFIELIHVIIAVVGVL